MQIVHVQPTRRFHMTPLIQFPEGSLPDERLRRRANGMMDAMTEFHGLPFSAAFTNPAAAVAAYHFVENDRLSFDMLTGALGRAYGARISSTPDDTMLAVSDTTELELTRLVSARGFGTVGNPECCGEFLHTSILISTKGVFEGFLTAKTWVRPENQRGKAQTRRQRPFEEKESFRWWEQIQEAEKRVSRRGLLLHVADRECDIFEVFQRSASEQIRLLVRAAHNRRVEGDERYLWETCEKWSVRGSRVLHIPAHRDSPDEPLLPARDAHIQLRFGQLMLRPPRSGEAAVESLPLQAILIREIAAPDDVKPVEWLLLTSDPLPDEAAAWLHVDYYRLRWGIEEFHKCLKSGCKVEERQYQEREHFDIHLALAIPVALRILRLTKLAREEPDLPASHELEPDELVVLFRRPVPTEGSTLQEAVRKIAMLGGYLGRRGDGPPGWLRLWRGYSRMCAQVEGYRLRL